MGFAETGERLWQMMSVAERVKFLRSLAKAIKRQPTWWGGRTIEVIADIPSFDNLPGDLRGRLFLAMKKDGFSIQELARTQKILD